MQKVFELYKSENGSVMVEFAIVSTVLILLLAGIIQFGLIFNVQLGLDNAAREGARFASLPSNANNNTATIAFITGLNPHISLTSSNITITPSVRQRGQPVQVKIEYHYKVPVTLGVFPENIKLSASATMMQN